MRYPWVCLAIFSVWVATVLLEVAKVTDPTTIFLYGSFSVLMLFFLGFARS